ncbi:MAG: hypothetical protein ACR2P0_12855 [Acidimicrobiales bacterium]
MTRRIFFTLAAAFALALAINACGSADPQPGESASAVDDSPASTEAVSTTTDHPDAPSFEADVLPILEGVCAQCHTAGGPGTTHWTLGTAGDAVDLAPTIAEVTSSRWMPPWPASDVSLPFLNDLSLSDEQIETLGAWTAADAPLDVDANRPIESLIEPQFIEDPDLTVVSAEGAYTGSTDLLDDYRCLIFDPEVTDTEWIVGSHFEPDQVEVVHHAIVTLHDSSARERAERLDASEPGPGYTCFGTSNLEGPRGGGVNLAGWAPGQPPQRYPEGYGVPVEPGDFVIVQIHYHFDETAPADLSRMVFEFADDATLETNGGSLKRLNTELYLGPAEIPCFEGDTDPLCDRGASMARVFDLYGPIAGSIPTFIHAQCGTSPQDFAHMTDGTASSTCELPVSNPGRIISVFGHMHEIGASIRLTKNAGEADEMVLLDIPDWDFDWQFGYQLQNEVILERGDRILVECGWDRARAPFELPGWVTWAEGTVDEMCYSSITTAPE